MANGLATVGTLWQTRLRGSLCTRRRRCHRRRSCAGHAENRPEWAIADLAVMAIGAIVVPAYTTNTEDDHHFIIDHSGASVAITSGGMLATRVCLAAERASALKTLITMNPDFSPLKLTRTKLLDWSQALEATAPLADLDARMAALHPDDVCCFIYTSGTGGRPKGVMLTHRSIQANIKAAIELEGRQCR